MASRYVQSLRYVLPLGGAFLTGALGVANYTAKALNGPRRRLPDDEFTFSPWEMQVPHELVSFRTEDGVLLKGWWFPRHETHRVIIGLSGHRRAKHDVLGIGSGLWRAGNNVLLFDFRGCGESDAVPLSVGYRELSDARAAIDYCFGRRQDASLGLVGYSMGAAVSLQVAAVDERVSAVVADSSFSSLRAVIAHAYQRRHVPVMPFLSIANALNQWRYKYSFDDMCPVDVIGRLAPRPVFLVHGGQDTLTPVNQAYQLFEAAGEPKELWIVHEAPHCGAYFVNRDQYVARVAEFFERSLTSSCLDQRSDVEIHAKH